MSDTVIKVENLSKKYIISHQNSGGYSTLRDRITEGAKSLGQNFGRAFGKQIDLPSKEEFWALKDISFEVKQGDRLGIIGRNGAGKSTLLKILSRITEPTKGQISIRGRVASLLEVGTGFHPELTGRENIFLNGAILGMSRIEIKQKFDEIVAFAEIEKFLDTPVKRYSSGMYVRLAFAVAAHLEPEILIVDEVLAVGDVGFQKKCLGKMEDVGNEGRSILFVSHNLGLIQRLCDRSLFLEAGSVLIDGSSSAAADCYLRKLENASVANLLERTDRQGKGDVKLSKLRISGSNYVSTDFLQAGASAFFTFYATGTLPGLSCCFTIYNSHGQAITNFDSAIIGFRDKFDRSNETEFVCRIDKLLLRPDRYRINAALFCGRELQDDIKGAAIFNVEVGEIGGRPINSTPQTGNIYIDHQWIIPMRSRNNYHV